MISVAHAGCAPDAGEVSSSEVRAPDEPAIVGGKTRGWPEATGHLQFEIDGDAVTATVGAARRAGLDAFWSVATTNPGSGFFYSDAIRGTGEIRVAHALDARSVKDIVDASALDFEDDNVGPVAVGGIVVLDHRPTHRYLAIVVDAIDATDPRTAGAGPYALADVTWYLTAPGEVDFSRAPDLD